MKQTLVDLRSVCFLMVYFQKDGSAYDMSAGIWKCRVTALSNGILNGMYTKRQHHATPLSPVHQVAEVQQRLQLLAMEAGRRGTGHW